jgi:hypothetical protein
MWYNPEVGIAFGAEPRIASRFLRNHLRDNCGFLEVGGHHHAPEDILATYKKEEAEGSDIWWGEKVPYFSAIRHPGDHVFSWFWPSIKRERFEKIGFDELRILRLPRYRIHYPDPNFWFKHIYVQPRTKYSILRYENLHADFNKLLAEYGLPLMHDFTMSDRYSDPSKPRHKGAWREYWEDEAWIWFSNKYKCELEYFDYVST